MIKCPACGEEVPAKFRLCGYCGATLASAPPPPPPPKPVMARKTVTVLFCDLKGSTALGEVLDPEALHEVKESYFDSMSAAILRHGGRIEKYIGDAIMAVFGLPRAREDDALRGVRAAWDMQEALEGLNAALHARYGVKLANRTGVNTGEVVAQVDGDADQRMATGDAVNVAARLEQAAPENAILLGELTWRLVRDAVEVEAVEPLELKGKSERVPAYRLLAASGLDGLARRHDRPLVGRSDELAALRRAFSDVRDHGVARLVTLVGDAGVGKSRLAHETMDVIAAGVRVLAGRCLPYGDGITFWPLMEMVRSAAGIRPGDTPEQAMGQVRSTVGDDAVAERLGAAIGLVDTVFPLQDINWAARKFFEQQAGGQPLVAFFDDIHWAEPALLDLLEHVVQTARSAPLLVLCTSRHDLLESRPDWSNEDGGLRLVLKPLPAGDAAQVVANLVGSGQPLPPEVVQRIVEAAEGNPLYVEQVVSMLVEQGVKPGADGMLQVPPTIHALLEARVDQLLPSERSTVEPAAVIGLEFEQRALDALAPPPVRPGLPEQLDALTRKQFIRRGTAVEGALQYRFQHNMVRETVYSAIGKRARASLHRALVVWVDAAYADRVHELDDVLGYHLEMAHRYLAELGPLDADGLAVGRDAARRLTAAGRRAAARGDARAAANLLRRAAALLPEGDAARLPLMPDLADSLTNLGDFAAAKTVLEEARRTAAAAGALRVQAAVELSALQLRLYSGENQGDWSAEALATANRWVPLLEADGADGELAIVWRTVTMVHGMAGRYGEATTAIQRSSLHARRAGNERLVVRNAFGLAINHLHGPTPVPEAILSCEKLLADGLPDRQIEGQIACVLAQLLAMDGRIAEAQARVRSSRAMLKDLGQGVFGASTGIELARVELRGGDLATAEAELSDDIAFLEAQGETYVLSSMAALQARIVLEQGRIDDGMAWSEVAEKATADDDLESAVLWRTVRAGVLLAQGSAAAARDVAEEALVLTRRTESQMLQAEALATLAAVHAASGDAAAALEAAEAARALYVAKGDRYSAARCEALIKAAGTTRSSC